jgi:hypothetical protein
MPFRAPRTVVEMLQMQDAAAALRAAGRMDSADAVESALRSVSFDPESMGVVQALRGFDPPVSRDPDIGMSLRGLSTQDIPAMEPTSFPGYTRGLDYDKSNSSFNQLASGRTLNLRNQNTDLNRIRRDDILTAAQEGIDRAAAATQAERMATAAAILGAAGLGGMIAETTGRLPGDGPSVANAPAPEMPESDPLMDFVAPDVDMLPVDDMPSPQERIAPVTLSDAEMGLTDFSPMDTADLVAESRPIPASTPAVAMELPAPKKPPMTAEQAAIMYSSEAKQQIDRLNSYRRQGLDPSTDRKMMQEIEHLHRLANEARRSASPLNYQRR